jgi:hypothetical protein
MDPDPGDKKKKKKIKKINFFEIGIFHFFKLKGKK